MGHARGWSNSKISMWVNGSRTRTDSNEQMVSPEEPNFLSKYCGRLVPSHLENTIREATILLRISFKERSQQQTKKYLKRRLLPPH